MKILEESKPEENKCPYCEIPLEFYSNEFKSPSFIHMIIGVLTMSWYDPRTGNQSFHCHNCKRDFLIEGYINKDSQNRENGNK